MTQNSITLMIAAIAWVAAMLRLLPRAWRLHRRRVAPGRGRRIPLEAVRSRARRLQALRA